VDVRLRLADKADEDFAMNVHFSCPSAFFLKALPAAALLGACLMAGPAAADLRICNQTANRIGISIGYQDGSSWVTEGWFNLKGNGCEIILKGKLNSRYYYVFALDYDRGGEWSGPNYMCTRDTEFSIRGPQDCHARGFDRAGFLEIDTAEQADWTVELGEGGQVGGQFSPRPPEK